LAGTSARDYLENVKRVTSGQIPIQVHIKLSVSGVFTNLTTLSETFQKSGTHLISKVLRTFSTPLCREFLLQEENVVVMRQAVLTDTRKMLGWSLSVRFRYR
jgi:hypothetical protein